MNLFSNTFVEYWSFCPKPCLPGLKVVSPGVELVPNAPNINLSRLYFQKIYLSFFTSTANANQKGQIRQHVIFCSLQQSTTGRIDFQSRRNSSRKTCFISRLYSFMFPGSIFLNCVSSLDFSLR